MTRRTAVLILALAQVPLSLAGCLEEFDTCADCHIYGVDEYGSCGYQVKEEDVNPGCGAADFPCITAALGVANGDPRCDKCAKMTVIEPGSTDPALCSGGGCPAYEQVVYLKAIDSTGVATFEVSQVAWKIACPYVCLGGSVCVKDPSVCVHGALEGENIHCSSGYKEIRWEEVECGSDSGGGGEDTTTTTTTKAGGGEETTTSTTTKAGVTVTTTTTDGDVATLTTSTSSSNCTGECVHNHNCDESEWCDQHDDYDPYCETVDQDMAHCPTPMCKWSTCDEEPGASSRVTSSLALLGGAGLALWLLA